MADPSTTPPTDEPYQVYFQGPRICNMDPQLMREFSVVVRCNRDGEEFPFTADLESVLLQHLHRQCTPEQGSKEDLETHIRQDDSFRSQSTAVIPQISSLALQSDDESGPSEAETLNLQSVLDTAFARAQSSHARIDNRGTWFLKLDITFMVKNSFGETLHIKLMKVDKQPEETYSSHAPLSFEFIKNAIDVKNKHLENSDTPKASLCLDKHKKGNELEEKSSMIDGITESWTVTKNDEGALDGAVATRGAQEGGDGGGRGGGDEGVGGGGHGGVGKRAGVGAEEVEGGTVGDNTGELLQNKVLVEKMEVLNGMVEMFKKISEMFNEFNPLTSQSISVFKDVL